MAKKKYKLPEHYFCMNNMKKYENYVVITDDKGKK